MASVPNFDRTLTLELLPALDEAIKNTHRPVRALVLTNPHNLFGQCYPLNVIEACLQFCERHDIHFISDEVYALSNFASIDSHDKAAFKSVLQVDPDALGVKRSRVYLV